MRYLCFMSFCLALILPLLFVWGCASPDDTDRIDIARALSDAPNLDCFDAVTGPRPLVFPEDAGPHENFRTEWWYYTGNLTTGQGRHFGYQLTFFRQALSCSPVTGISRWRTRQLYFAHFALTDTRSNAYHAFSRMNRQSLGIAGSRAKPFTVWIDNWQVKDSGSHLILNAASDDITLSLHLVPQKPPIFQGDRGYSKKGPGTGNASFYYSLPRLHTKGSITVGETRFQVTGHSWFDHEWSTTVLGEDVQGWDWFSTHLDDGRDLMVCRIRKADGSSSGFGFGSISFADGTYVILSETDFTLTPKERWKSPETGKRYPVQWQIRIPDHNLDLSVTPVMNNQEHTHTFAYWEGAMRFSGPVIQGMGYLEMTGY
ncbi:MAG TPA: lipocalin-like domain-containing protein [Desulfotignum sp.]|nr:lipocalin-like domain-containing protein [Desulfotignum sp.]